MIEYRKLRDSPVFICFLQLSTACCTIQCFHEALEDVSAGRDEFHVAATRPQRGKDGVFIVYRSRDWQPVYIDRVEP